MINPMLYIVPSTAYGGAFAPLPITNVLPSTDGNGQHMNPHNSELNRVMKEIQGLEKRVSDLEIQKTISDPDANIKPDDTREFQSQKQPFSEVKETIDANSAEYAKCDIHMIGDTLLFKFAGIADIQSMKVSEFSLETESKELQLGHFQLTGVAKLQDMSIENHYVEIRAGGAERSILNKMHQQFEIYKKRQTAPAITDEEAKQFEASKIHVFLEDMYNGEYKTREAGDIAMIGKKLWYRFEDGTDIILSMNVSKIDQTEDEGENPNFGYFLDSEGKVVDALNPNHVVKFRAKKEAVIKMRKIISAFNKLPSQ